MSRKRRLTFGGAATTIIGLVVGAIFVALGIFVFSDPKFSPQLLQGIDFNLGKTVTMIGIVLILFPVINSLYVKPLKEAIDSRNNELERTFTEAEELRARMDQMRSEYEQRLAETEASAREQIQAQIKEAQKLRTELVAEANAKRDEMIKKASEEIEYEKNRVMAEIRMEVVNLTLTATERILGESVDNDRNRKLVQEFIDKVEVPG